SVPVIAPVSAGVFSTLQIIFQPQVVLSVKHYWMALPLAAFAIWIIREIRRSGLAFALLVLSILFLLGMVLQPILLSAFSPALSRGGQAGSTMASVRVLDRQNVGLFDTATIQSADPA